jgi:hypothetical protein
MEMEAAELRDGGRLKDIRAFIIDPAWVILNYAA